MKRGWVRARGVALLALGVMVWTWDAAPPSGWAELSPHLGYGANLRYLENVDTLYAPLGFDWVKVYERFDTMPTQQLSYQVLYRIDISHGDRWLWVDSLPYRPDLGKIRDDVAEIAQQGLGVVDAYEIGNEPNMDWEWMDQPPDPADYVAVLQVAYEAIKEVDPGAVVVSGGLGPVGRINNTCPPNSICSCTANSGQTYQGNNCGAMDERLFAREMFSRGAGRYFDVFGYHPIGFAYEPERPLEELPSDDNDNGFAFRGAEVMHAIMEDYGLGNKPIWATEFGWLRDPSEDGMGWCWDHPDFAGAKWYALPEVTQADYLTRAFRYADDNWPWVGAMFVWAFDFHQEGAACWPGTYFSVLERNGTPSIQGIPTLAYSALVSMTKRPGHFGPRLVVTPTALSLVAGADEPRLFTSTVVPQNAGYRVMMWMATVAADMGVTPTLVATTGYQGSPMTVTVDSAGYSTGTFTGMITVTATTSDVVGAPKGLPVTLIVVSHVYHAYLPVTVRPET